MRVMATPAHRPASQAVWAGVARLVDRADSPLDLKMQGIHLLAARRWRELGTAVPRAFVEDELRASVMSLAGYGLLRRVRDSCEGNLLVLKGPEVAAYYPDPALRSFVDVDLLVPDAPRTQRELMAAGFSEVGDPELFVDIHHLRPLVLPTIPVAIEVHDRPKWPEGMATPPTGELFDAAVDSVTGVDGVLGLPPAHHALVVAAHSWAHFPLYRLKDIVDVAALSDGVPRSELDDLARSWSLDRVWQTTAAAMDALLNEGDTPLPLRLWARHLPRVRERTVLEQHLMRLLSPFWAAEPRTATVQAARALAAEFRARPGEARREKLARSVSAVLRPGSRLTDRESDRRA
jgi:Uncharacterised nucleotidyltransferase